jgi:hypothetical protein
MNKKSLVTGVVCLSAGLAFMLAPACGSNSGSGFNPTSGSGSGGGSGGSGSGGSGSGGIAPILPQGDGSTNPTPTGDGAVTCVNLQCQQGTCGDGGGATLTGHIYDPAGNNPLYKVVAYIPNADPLPITDGITADSCSCGDLYTGTPIADGITDPSGFFTVTNAPVGNNIPIVIQIGKWRNYFTIPTVACGENNLDTILPAKLTLPKTQGETKFSNIPNIAVSTGNADSLECLLKRVGVAESEYTGTPDALADGGQPGHIHIFAGTEKLGAPGPVPNTVSPAGPSSSGTGGLWDSDSDIKRFDIVLLSCEGQETTGTNSTVLADFVNAGGRVFASHYHYAFFNTASEFTNTADWSQAGGDDNYSKAISASIQTTLANGSPFPEGQALYSWLGDTVGALTGNVDAGTALLPITVARHDAVVAAGNVSTAWAQSSGANPASTQYFSWDMPFNAALNDAGQPSYCGRVVFSDLHVGAGEDDYGCTQSATDQCEYTGTTPTACASHTLLPDEDAIEFILFDLSSCVTPVTSAPQPPPPIILPPPPPK